MGQTVAPGQPKAGATCANTLWQARVLIKHEYDSWRQSGESAQIHPLEMR